MGQALIRDTRISPEAYLEGEQLADEKHEYIRGEIYAMAGASDSHVKVTLNAAITLRQHLRGSGCSTYIADMKVRLEKDNLFFYPDVMVSCDPADQSPDHKYAKQHPKLIIEVLSPSTEDRDRGSKFLHYRTLPSLQEYILVDPERYYVEIFRRQNGADWLLTTHTGVDARLSLHSIGLEVMLADWYEDVRFDTESA
ncbi:MAG TPA: Uma2 family endonuclease [Thiolinea sp.]|nr:Uma2 family endonuclease [Thiolinea sp.]